VAPAPSISKLLGSGANVSFKIPMLAVEPSPHAPTQRVSMGLTSATAPEPIAVRSS